MRASLAAPSEQVDDELTERIGRDGSSEDLLKPLPPDPGRHQDSAIAQFSEATRESQLTDSYGRGSVGSARNLGDELYMWTVQSYRESYFTSALESL